MNRKPLFYAIAMFVSVVAIYLLIDAFVLTPIIDKIVK